jgi:hypothetical protein
VRVAVFTAVAVLALTGCGSKAAASRAEACTNRFMDVVNQNDPRVTKAQLRHYVEVTYCNRFAREGWIYEDGALSIDAQRWLVDGARCSTSTTGGSTRTIPCEVVENGVMDCAMLRFVRRREVQAYIAELQRHESVTCDDGTPLTALGVP